VRVIIAFIVNLIGIKTIFEYRTYLTDPQAEVGVVGGLCYPIAKDMILKPSQVVFSSQPQNMRVLV
jgi:hypothetical protein